VVIFLPVDTAGAPFEFAHLRLATGCALRGGVVSSATFGAHLRPSVGAASRRRRAAFYLSDVYLHRRHDNESQRAMAAAKAGDVTAWSARRKCFN
jgi:hypothetical protein